MQEGRVRGVARECSLYLPLLCVYLTQVLPIHRGNWGALERPTWFSLTGMLARRGHCSFTYQPQGEGRRPWLEWIGVGRSTSCVRDIRRNKLNLNPRE
jgi:hypothetical protein